MLKKLMLLISCVSLLALVACDEENETAISNSGRSEPQQSDASINDENDEEALFGFTIEIISEEDFEELEGIYTQLNYAEARNGFVTEGITLIFEFTQAVSDFTLVEIDITEEGTLVTTGLLSRIGDLAPDEPLVLTQYHTQGTAIPRSGFYFIDANGNEKWFTLNQSTMDGSIVWSPFHWSRAYGFYDLHAEPEVIEIVPYVYHMVRRGETLFSISRLYGTTVEVLQELNELGDSTNIAAGQNLRLPPGSVPDETLLMDGDDVQFSEIVFNFELLEDEKLPADLVNAVGFDYSEFFGLNEKMFNFLVIRTTRNQLSDFQVVAIEWEEDGEFKVTDVIYEIPVFDPDNVLVIRYYYDRSGAFPRTGFTFIDEFGETRLFGFNLSRIDVDTVVAVELNR